MAYNDTPLAAQRINASQPLIREDFSILQTAFSINHTALGLPAQGKHTFISLPEQGASPATAADECALYSKQGTGTVTQLFYRPEGSGTEVEFTYALKNANGYTYLPSGLLMKWGFSNANGVTPVTINSAPQFQHIYSLNITPYSGSIVDSNKTVVLSTLIVNAGTSFIMNVDGSRRLSATAVSCNFYWVAIGD